MAFYLTVDTDLADSFDRNIGQFTVSLVTPIYFNGNWKVAVLDYGFMNNFTTIDNELIHVTCEMIESQLICMQEQRVLISVPRLG